MKALLAVLSLALLVGCAHGSPPTAFELAIYDVRTQLVAVVTLQTNYVNAPGGTNVVPAGVSPVTNYAEDYQYQPKKSVITGIQTGGQIATTFGFGLGGVVASLLLGAYGAWATWRSNRKGKLNTILAQGTEVAREVIRALPNGTANEARFLTEIGAQQVAGGVKAAAESVSHEEVNAVEAKASADRVMKL